MRGFSRWEPRIQLESGKRGAIAIVAGIGHNVPLHGIAMNAGLMMHKIDGIPNPVMGEAALPDFLIGVDDRFELM
jgi:hypothetical protein